MQTDARRRREARQAWKTQVFHHPAEADRADLEDSLSLCVGERIDLVARLSLEAFRRAAGDPDARPQLQRSVVLVSRDLPCQVIGPREMLTNKRAAGRAKDLADAESLEQIFAATNER